MTAEMKLDEAIAVLVLALKAKTAGQYGYDLFPKKVAQDKAHELYRHDGDEKNRYAIRIAPVVFDAAWELCRRGIVRPGPREITDQVVEFGYSLTANGRSWLATADDAQLLLTQPGSLGVALAGFRDKYGDAYYQRSQEALKCRDGEAWLACCAMAGASAEAILLAIANAKTKDEERIRREYFSSGGRKKVTDIITGKLPQHLRQTLVTFTGIISFWRDEASHGALTMLSTANADEALRQLLHMAQWVDRQWDALTSAGA